MSYPGRRSGDCEDAAGEREHAQNRGNESETPAQRVFHPARVMCRRIGEGSDPPRVRPEKEQGEEAEGDQGSTTSSLLRTPAGSVLEITAARVDEGPAAAHGAVHLVLSGKVGGELDEIAVGKKLAEDPSMPPEQR